MVLTQIRLLLTQRNIGDPLDARTADELRERPHVYFEKAKRMTAEFAQPRCAEDGSVRIPSDEDEV
jgi:ubiquitin-protein ligase